MGAEEDIRPREGRYACTLGLYVCARATLFVHAADDERQRKSYLHAHQVRFEYARKTLRLYLNDINAHERSYAWARTRMYMRMWDFVRQRQE